jgi:hypothetical protein
MIIHEAPQRTPEWHKARAGVLTASCFDTLLTPAKLELAKGRTTYLYQTAAERMLGYCEEIATSIWMERGTEMEGEAREAYELVTDETVQPVGLIYRDQRREVGCSPDGLIYHGQLPIGGLELKCPKAGTHVSYLIEGGCPADYRHQVQGCLWVTGLPWWDFVSYYPGLPLHVARILPDPVYHAALDAAIPVVLAELAEILDKIGGAK